MLKIINMSFCPPTIGIHTYQKPPWLGNEDFHRSHRSNLLRKYPEHYRQFWPDEPDNLPYFWPTKEGF
jgi:hypothetical protein